ncbi:hypothetical protein [Rhizobium ruizarguesonis]|uniref:hypothetical protein n=1 Tax=Rhizobium ruizarguesonis TaxID=2081791 RepID=UPI001031D66B|nr:hypothetical protein [Rhizobium ruizarguesonis]NEH81842.1 hypothetical protein [Rhizobium ruizarguesonis]NEI79458.1 hypothetical protein [Rhizobium ruizarguesonis]TBD62646.1 hypothetical protein ELH22_04490 [Rhizobium ruizarguesonis]
MRSTIFACMCGLVLVSCNGVNDAGKNVGLSNIVVSLGYDPLALPSTAYGPGSLVTSVKGSGLRPPLRLTYLCRPDFAKTPSPIVDPAASSVVSSALNRSFQLDASALGQFGLGAHLNSIRSVKVTLNNVTVEQLAYDDLKAVRSELGPKCKELVDEFSQKSLAYQTQQAIRADVVYSFELKSGASSEVKGLAIQALTAAFGGSVQADHGSTVTGKGLFYGLVLTKV